MVDALRGPVHAIWVFIESMAAIAWTWIKAGLLFSLGVLQTFSLKAQIFLGGNAPQDADLATLFSPFTQVAEEVQRPRYGDLYKEALEFLDAQARRSVVDTDFLDGNGVANIDVGLDNVLQGPEQEFKEQAAHESSDRILENIAGSTMDGLIDERAGGLGETGNLV